MAGYTKFGESWVVPQNFYVNSPVWIVVNNWYFGWIQLDGAESTQSQLMDTPTATYSGPIATPAVTPAEATQSQVIDAAGAVGINLSTPAEATQSQTGDASSAKGIYVINCAEGTQNQLSDASTGIAVSVSTPAESTQSQAMDSSTGISIYVVNPLDGSQTQVMDEAICAFFAGSTTVSVTPEDNYQTQFMDLVYASLFGDTGFGTRVPISYEMAIPLRALEIDCIAYDENYPIESEARATITSGNNRRITASRG